MKKLLLTTPQAILKPGVAEDIFPKKPVGWQIETRPSGSLEKATSAPDVTMVQVGNETRPAEIKALIPRLVDIQAKAPSRSFVLFSFKEKVRKNVQEIRAQERRIQNAVTQINIGLPNFPNPQLVNVTFAQTPAALQTELDHIRAKLDLPIQTPEVRVGNVPPRPSALDQVKEVLAATEDLRSSTGNLSAAAVASAFGVSISRLSDWLGRSRQAVTKTPEADSLQEQLSFFERVARLRAVIPHDRFLKWLRMSNSELDGQKPLELLAAGQLQVIADLVDDMLTGASA